MITPAVNDTATRELTRIWQDVLGVESIEPDQDYFDLGGDSSTAVQMFTRIEQAFHVKLPLVTLYEAPTILELLQILRAGEERVTAWTPLVPIQPRGTRPPFFCFHGAGGNVLIYRKLSLCLGSDQPFYGLQSLGLDGLASPLTTIEEMATLYLAHIRAVQPHGPYYLGGYCMGGTVAYEVAQQLLRAGEPVAMLALLDTMNWHKVPLTLWSVGSHHCQRIWFHVATFFNLDLEDMAKLFREKRETLQSRIPVWRGILKARFSRNVSAKDISAPAVLGRVWKINDSACWRYIPQPYSGAITDFRPARQYSVFQQPGLKWETLAQGGQRIVVLPVYPAGMLVEPFVKHLATALTKAIDEATAPPNSEAVLTLGSGWSKTWTFFEGEWHAGNVPIMGPRTHAAWLCSMVFDGARAFEDVTPDLDLHCVRVNDSAAKLYLPPCVSTEEWITLAREGIARFDKGASLYIRPMYWAEKEGPWIQAHDPESTRWCLSIYEAPMRPPRGFSITLSPFRRPTLDTMPVDAKAGCLYPNNARALFEAHSRKFDNAVVCDVLGNVAELATSNIFMAKDGVVFTPIPNGTFLAGITRQRVIGLLRANGLIVVEKTLTYSDLQAADEIFSTGNYSKVVPITRIDDRTLAFGPLYNRARELYWAFAHS